MIRRLHRLRFPAWVVLALAAGFLPPLGAVDFWFESATVKVRQDAAPKSLTTWRIKAARNEFEPFQLVLKARAGETLSAADVEISDFTGTAGTISKDNVTIFLVKYMNIENISTTEGKVGEWPDILCPKVDAYYREKRNFFPFQLASSRVQPIWFDVFVPLGTKPGTYSADVKVVNGTATIFSGKVFLEVWNFALPATSSYPTYFIMSMDGAWKGHYGGTWPPGGMPTVIDNHRMYMRAGLRHRFTFSPIAVAFSKFDGRAYSSVDGTNCLESVQGFLGEADGGVEYGRASITAFVVNFSSIVRAYLNCSSSSTTVPAALLTETRARARALASALPASLRSMTTVLPLDEPGGGEVGCGSANPGLDYNVVKEMAKIIHAEGLRVHITKRRVPELLNTSVTPPRNDYIDAWDAPFMGIVGHDWNFKLFNRRPEYDDDVQRGGQVWWYQSCMTHGCATLGGTQYAGYPQYSIEYSAIHSRIFPWMTYKYDINGELYYAVLYSYNADPWSTLWMPMYFGNGDGTFFYPGVPDAKASGLPSGTRGAHTPSIGGTRNIPIESVRIKMMREGMEDYEYMKLLANLGEDELAKQEVSRAVENTYTFTGDPALIYEVRENLALDILSRLANAGDLPPSGPRNLRISR